MGLMCELTFDGISSKDIGVTVEGFPGAFIPERDFDKETIPGRNGDLIYDYGTYKNYSQSFTIHWRYTHRDARISQWLCKNGYRRLEDSFHPEHYRMAHFTGSSEIDNRMQVLKRAEIPFDFKPQWFRKTGDYPMNVYSGRSIVNSGMPTRPLFTIKGSGAGEIVINGIKIAISSIPSAGLVLDCELQDAYSVDKLTNYNNLITLTGFEYPKFEQGLNTVTFSGGIKEVKAIPRWWDIL